jgi:hypothetical protein
LVDDSFVPSSKWPSVLYCKLTDLCSWVNIQVFSDATWAQMCCYNSNPILPLLLAPAKSRAIKNKDLLYFTLLCSTMLGNTGQEVAILHLCAMYRNSSFVFALPMSMLQCNKKAWTMGQTNRRPSVWCCKYYFFHDFLQNSLQKSFQFIFL